MFKIIPDPTFKADVLLTVPGQADQVKVNMTFRHKDRAALIELDKSLRDKKTKVEDILVDLIEDWDGINSPCDKESITAFCYNYVAAPLEVINAYKDELIQSKIKN